MTEHEAVIICGSSHSSVDINRLMKSIGTLSERFGVYYDQIKAEGGELKDLEL